MEEKVDDVKAAVEDKSNGLKLEGLQAAEEIQQSPTKVAESPLIRQRVNSVADDEWGDTDSKARKLSIVVQPKTDWLTKFKWFNLYQIWINTRVLPYVNNKSLYERNGTSVNYGRCIHSNLAY